MVNIEYRKQQARRIARPRHLDAEALYAAALSVQKDAPVSFYAALLQAAAEATAAESTPAVRGKCLYCLAEGPAGLFEPIGGNVDDVACKARECCRIREAGERPAYYLSALLRAVRAELAQASAAELAALAVDLGGYRAAVVAELARQGGGQADIAAEAAGREAGKAARRS